MPPTRDAVLIARLTAQLRCYRPEPANATWARLRQLGIRRARLVRDLPVGVRTAAQLSPGGVITWSSDLSRSRAGHSGPGQPSVPAGAERSRPRVFLISVRAW
jgi:hypothetical protein